MATDRATFPDDFRWGAATASYQIEGAAHERGRGESVWDRFAATPGKVRNGDTGEIACDFYHRYREDIALMKELGLDAFRFSIAWPRVLPEGRGRVNPLGLDFYDRLVDALLEHEIEPFATLFHWDTPQALEDVGGWPARETAEAFVEYTEAVVDRLGDRVKHWLTHNEPWVCAWIGYAWGEHAPGRKSEADAVAAAHHLLLSHGWAVQAIRRSSPDAQVGIVLNLAHTYPASGSPEDEAAAWKFDGAGNRWFLDPVFRGSYPADLLERLAIVEPFVRDGDLEAMSTPIDLLGVNNYFRFVVGAGAEGPQLKSDPEALRTDMGWEVYPDGLHALLTRVAEDYSPPAIYVTENGAAFGDVRGHDGRVHDPERTAYLQGHIGAVERAVADGVPVKGYFVWSLLDNFEWAHGYSKRFGIVYIDYPTLERVPKDSFYWYRDFIASRRGAPRPSPVATG
jgi:beta-glucosidase